VGHDDDDHDDGDEGADEDADEGRRRHRPWLWAATSTLTILIGLVLLAAYPAERRRADEYQRAPVCERPPAAAEHPQCVHEVDGVVERTREPFRRRGRDRYVDYRLSEPSWAPSPQGTTEVDGDSAVYRAMKPGTPAVFGVWGASVARIRIEGVGTVETVGSPRAQEAKAVGVGVILVPAGGVGLWAAFRFRRRSGSWFRRTAIPPAKGVQRGAVLFLGGLGFAFGVLLPLAGGEYDVATLFVTGLFLGALGGLAGWALYRWRGRRD
jgi:hypothetical protein